MQTTYTNKATNNDTKVRALARLRCRETRRGYWSRYSTRVSKRWSISVLLSKMKGYKREGTAIYSRDMSSSDWEFYGDFVSEEDAVAHLKKLRAGTVKIPRW